MFLSLTTWCPEYVKRPVLSFISVSFLVLYFRTAKHKIRTPGRKKADPCVMNYNLLFGISVKPQPTKTTTNVWSLSKHRIFRFKLCSKVGHIRAVSGRAAVANACPIEVIAFCRNCIDMANSMTDCFYYNCMLRRSWFCGFFCSGVTHLA